MPYAVENLIEGRGKPISVRPTDSAKNALDAMIERDFSQLPVIDDEERPLGIVTHESILRALKSFGGTLDDLQVSDATVNARIAHADDDLFDVLDRLPYRGDRQAGRSRHGGIEVIFSDHCR